MSQRSRYPNRNEEEKPIPEIDDRDRKIIAVLKDNAQLPIREIAKKIQERPSTVHQRIQKLVQNNVIEKYTVKTNDTVMNESLLVILLVKGSTQKYLSSSVLKDSRVKEVIGITGEYDLLIKLKFSDVQEFNDYVIDFRRKNPHVRSTLTMVGTANIKEEL